jgi:hypothetical protein
VKPVHLAGPVLSNSLASSDRTIKLWEAAPVSALAPTGEAPVAASKGDRPARSPGGVVADAR